MSNNEPIDEFAEKVICSFIFWICVALAFPLVALFSVFLGLSNELPLQHFFKIAEYYNKGLITGQIVGCVLSYLIASLMKALFSTFFFLKKNTKGNLKKRVIDDINSQIYGIGSLINAILIIELLGKLVPNLRSYIFDIGLFWWAGLLTWAIAFLINKSNQTEVTPGLSS